MIVLFGIVKVKRDTEELQSDLVSLIAWAIKWQKNFSICKYEVMQVLI